jgi:hypothetical protein
MDNINDHLVERYRAAYRDEFGEEISPEKASEELSRLTNVLRLLLEEE